MEHEQAQELLSGYLDQELGLSETLAFEAHLETCAQCRAELAQQRALSAQLAGAGLRADAPQALLDRIAAELRAQHPRRTLRERLGQWGTSQPWPALASVALVVLMMSSSLTFYLAVPSKETRLTQEVVDDHIRSLQFDHLSDVISTDKHTVKPWFNGKLDFAPPVIDLAQAGYPLTGGRLDFLDGHPVAVMVYHYKLHPINLYVWPGRDAGAAPQVREQRGYHYAHWSAAGMNFWAITDAGNEELQGFVKNLRAQGAA